MNDHPGRRCNKALNGLNTGCSALPRRPGQCKCYTVGNDLIIFKNAGVAQPTGANESGGRVNADKLFRVTYDNFLIIFVVD